MNKHLAIVTFLLASITMYGQDPKTILTKSRQKCQSIQNGYYEMTHYMLPMTQKDTTRTTITCHFDRIANDTVCPSAFHSKRYLEGKLTHDILYTGNDYVKLNPKDSSAMTMTKSLWAEQIAYSIRGDDLYAPLTDGNGWPMPDDSDYVDGRHTFRFVGTDNIGNVSCYHVQIDEAPSYDSTYGVKYLRIERHIWISKDNSMPVQYSAAVDVIMNNDTMYQYEMFRLDRYELDNLNNKDVLTLNSIPAYAKVKDFAQYEGPEPLAINSNAPNWELYSLKDRKFSLHDMRGNVVLVDFFYRSCFGCMLALPVVQALHEKYKDRGLIVVGIDPFDKKDEIEPFLTKRGVTYTVLLGGINAAKDYHISGYPTLFLIDKQGRIIDIHDGYTKSMEGKLEALIIKNL